MLQVEKAIDLLMQISWRILCLKILKDISVECIECLNKDAKKKGQILYIMGRDDQITTSAKLLDITHVPYGFNADLIDTIN